MTLSLILICFESLWDFYTFLFIASSFGTYINAASNDDC